MIRKKKRFFGCLPLWQIHSVALKDTSGTIRLFVKYELPALSSNKTHLIFFSISACALACFAPQFKTHSLPPSLYASELNQMKKLRGWT